MKTRFTEMLFAAAAALILAAQPTFASPAQILIIRHAEKPDSGDDLSSAGYARAQALVKYFETTPAVTRFGTPLAIYAAGVSEDKSTSKRSVETVTPLAQALGLTVQSQFTKKDVGPAATEILSHPEYDGHMVLIAWEHDMIPSLATQLGAANVPDSWPDDDFYGVWELDYSNNQVFKFDIFSQHLMPGDPSQ